MSETAVTKDECRDHRQGIDRHFEGVDKDLQQCREDYLDRNRGILDWNTRLEGKMDRLLFWLMATFAGIIITFAFVVIGRLFDFQVI